MKDQNCCRYCSLTLCGDGQYTSARLCQGTVHIQAGVAQYRDEAMGWMTRVQFLEGAMMGLFSLCHCIWTGSAAHPAFYPVGTRGSFPRDKVSGA